VVLAGAATRGFFLMVKAYAPPRRLVNTALRRTPMTACEVGAKLSSHAIQASMAGSARSPLGLNGRGSCARLPADSQEE
jgi:hypothetical protein